MCHISRATSGALNPASARRGASASNPTEDLQAFLGETFQASSEQGKTTITFQPPAEGYRAYYDPSRQEVVFHEGVIEAHEAAHAELNRIAQPWLPSDGPDCPDLRAETGWQIAELSRRPPVGTDERLPSG